MDGGMGEWMGGCVNEDEVLMRQQQDNIKTTRQYKNKNES